MGENLAAIVLAGFIGIAGGWTVAHKNPSVILKVPFAYDVRRDSLDPYYLDMRIEDPDGKGDALVATYKDKKFLVEESKGVPVFVPYDLWLHGLPKYDPDGRNKRMLERNGEVTASAKK